MNLPVTLIYFCLLCRQQGYNLISQEGPRKIVALRALLLLLLSLSSSSSSSLYVIAEDVRGVRKHRGEIN